MARRLLSNSISRAHFLAQRGVASSTQATPLPNRVFVSSYYELGKQEVVQFLTRQNIEHSAGTGRVALRNCLCDDDEESNQWKVSVDKRQGNFSCQKCGISGSWFDLKQKLSGYQLATSTTNDVSAGDDKESKPQKSLSEIIENQAQSLAKATSVRDYLLSLGLKPETLAFFQLGGTTIRFLMDSGKGVVEDHSCMTFPLMASINASEPAQIVRIKSQSIWDARCQKLEPKQGELGFFGWNSVKPGSKHIIITESELDVMAIWQATGFPTVALPSGGRSLPISLLPMIESFEKIYIWLHDDVPGQETAEKHARKLGMERCYIVKTRMNNPKGPQSPMEAFKNGHNLSNYLQSATKVAHQQIIRFSSLRSEVYNEFVNPAQVSGTQSTYFPTLNKILKGHRRGELTLLSGPTGIGKTSMLAQLSLDYCMQGISTLWGSFEIKNVRLAKKMLNMFANKNFDQDMSDFDTWANKFDQLPLHFLKFFGSTKVELVLDAMEHAVYVHDVEHIVLDNLQFMTSGQGKGFERFEIHDRAIESFRTFASNKNVHITIVIHPRKEDDNQPLMTSSIFGTAKATQEADNVLIVQRGQKYRFLEVKKNRFDGQLGVIPYQTDPVSGLIREIDMPMGVKPNKTSL